MKSTSPVYLAVDLGASSGRVIAGWVEEGRLGLEEAHRFPTPFVRVGGSHHWDILGLWSSIVEGLRRAGEKFGGRVAGIGVDTWGVDYALLDAGGKLLGNPYQYRDARTETMMEWVFGRISREAIFAETGIQFMYFNTLYQLAAEAQGPSGALRAADRLLFLPDLISYWLCGVAAQERTIASTSQMWNPEAGDWSEAIIGALGLERKLFQPVIEPGTSLGPLREEVREMTGLGPVPVVAVAGHDTGSAVAGTPLSAAAPAFLSSGTWSLMGVELPRPVIGPEVLAAGFSNEAGVGGTTRFLKNICGMWLIEQLRDQWAREGAEYSYDQLLDMAREARPFTALIDPDDARFARPGRMAEKVREFCRATRQAVPETKGELVRTAFESLACKYRIVFDALERVNGRPLPSLRIVGGGSRNGFLNQITANALERPVLAGPVEATSLGNLLVQLQAAGHLASLAEGREVVEASFPAKIFEPREAGEWAAPVKRLRELRG